MPPYEQNVNVTFTPGTTPTNGTWTFDPVTVHMTAAGKIILHRSPQTATWQFVTATGLPSDWPVTVEGNGSLMKIQDPHDPPYGPPPIKYSVQVTDGTSNFDSPMQTASPTAVVGGPPPMVQNDP